MSFCDMVYLCYVPVDRSRVTVDRIHGPRLAAICIYICRCLHSSRLAWRAARLASRDSRSCRPSATRTHSSGSMTSRASRTSRLRSRGSCTACSSVSFPARRAARRTAPRGRVVWDVGRASRADEPASLLSFALSCLQVRRPAAKAATPRQSSSAATSVCAWDRRPRDVDERAERSRFERSRSPSLTQRKTRSAVS